MVIKTEWWEACAGLLDLDAPEQCIIRETEEETGYRITKVQKVMETYMSPGVLTEILYLLLVNTTNQWKSMKEVA
jgi:8-oxo-dGTP pyrophosphatase MutT (NUDIX family)